VRQAWKSLSEAGLVEMRPDELSQKIQEVKHVVIVRLSELLQIKNDVEERESAAYSLATLKRIETTLRENAPKPATPDPAV